MRHRRGDVKIIMDILGISLNGERLTHLMYKANLSYSSLRKYLIAMSNQGLIYKTNNGNGSAVYKTTEKGRALLNELRVLKDCLATWA